MTQIENYINDGANWQAQAVLAYIRAYYNNPVHKTWNNDTKRYDADIYVGRYENCREQGYVFSIRYMTEQRNYAVYEHRNSDALCVVVFDGITINTPTIDMVCAAMNNDKRNVTASFSSGEICKCGDYIIEDMANFVQTIQDIKGK